LTSLLVFILLVINANAVQAAPSKAALEQNESSVPDARYQKQDDFAEVDDYTSIEFLDWTQETASSYVEGLNDGVDSFFMGAFFDDEEKIEDSSSGSNGRIFFSSRREDGVEPDYRGGINLRLVLPNTRDRFKLLLETDEDEDDSNETNVLNTTENVTYSTALRVEVDRGKNWKTSFDNGVRWSGEPVYFSRIRGRRQDYFDDWRTKVTQTVSWRTDEEWGANFRASALRPLDIEHHFRMAFEADYLLNDDYANLDLGFSLFHEINARSALLLDLTFLGSTESYSKVDSSILALSYRRKIFTQYLFLEMVPEVAWPRENSYDVTPAFTILLEMIFGVEQ